MTFLLAIISITSLTFNTYQAAQVKALESNYRNLQCIQLGGDYQAAADYCKPNREEQ